MLVDIVSSHNLQSYNVWLAHKIGLNNAIYLSVLINLNQFAIQNNTLVPDNYFWVDREYVLTRTTFSVEDQLRYEETLISMGLISLSKDKQHVQVEYNTLLGLAKTVNEDVIDCFEQVKKKASKGTKADGILKSVIRRIPNNYPGNVQEELKNWLTVLNNRFGYVNNLIIDTALNILEPIIFSDINKAIEIIKICNYYAYRDVQWGISRYNDNHKNIQTTVTTNTDNKLSDDYF